MMRCDGLLNFGGAFQRNNPKEIVITSGQSKAAANAAPTDEVVRLISFGAAPNIKAQTGFTKGIPT